MLQPFTARPRDFQRSLHVYKRVHTHTHANWVVTNDIDKGKVGEFRTKCKLWCMLVSYVGEKSK